MRELPWGILAATAWWMLAGTLAAGFLGGGMRRRLRAGEAITNAEKRALGGLVALAAAPIPSLIQYSATGRYYWAGIGLATLGGVLLVSGLLRDRSDIRARKPPRYSFREKSAAITLIAIMLVYGGTTAVLLRAPATPAVALGMLIVSSIAMTIIMTASHIVLAIAHPPEKTDERDRTVSLRSMGPGYWTLAVVIWCVVLLAVFGAPPAILAYSAMGGFVLSEIARLASQLLYYRYFWFDG
jgi:hypothetical protein